jgi:hypothetical protein
MSGELVYSQDGRVVPISRDELAAAVAAVAGKANKSRIIDKISEVERYSERPNW